MNERISRFVQMVNPRDAPSDLFREEDSTHVLITEMTVLRQTLACCIVRGVPSS